MPSTEPQKFEVLRAERKVDRSLDELEFHMEKLADKLEEEVRPVVQAITFPQKMIQFLSKHKIVFIAATGILSGLFFLNKKR